MLFSSSLLFAIRVASSAYLRLTLEDEPSSSVGITYVTGEEWQNSSGNKWLSQSGSNTKLWMCLGVKVKSNAIRNKTA